MNNLVEMFVNPSEETCVKNSVRTYMVNSMGIYVDNYTGTSVKIRCIILWEIE